MSRRNGSPVASALSHHLPPRHNLPQVFNPMPDPLSSTIRPVILHEPDIFVAEPPLQPVPEFDTHRNAMLVEIPDYTPLSTLTGTVKGAGLRLIHNPYLVPDCDGAEAFPVLVFIQATLSVDEATLAVDALDPHGDTLFGSYCSPIFSPYPHPFGELRSLGNDFHEGAGNYRAVCLVVTDFGIALLC